jgi:hypothetical protein
MTIEAPGRMATDGERRFGRSTRSFLRRGWSHW